MDILIHIILIIIIGIFFFIDKYSPTNNAMFIVILLTFFGFIFLIGDSTIELVDYSSVVTSGSTASHPSTDISSVGLGIFSVLSFHVLVYMFFLIVGVTNLYYENNKGVK